MRFAYADPPYPGQARLYAAEAKRAGRVAVEVNHEVLIGTLCDSYPDGWALSTSSPALRLLLPLCPPDVRIAAWVKPFCSFKPGVNPAYAWEPVIFRGGRKRERTSPTLRDFTSCNITLRKGVPGAKPLQVCHWILDLLGFESGDSLEDLFPGTDIMASAVASYCQQQRLAFGGPV